MGGSLCCSNETIEDRKDHTSLICDEWRLIAGVRRDEVTDGDYGTSDSETSVCFSVSVVVSVSTAPL